jgi:hypothetical protein
MSLIPTNQKWQKYTTQNKWALIAAIATVLGLLFTIYSYYSPPTLPPSISDVIVKDENQTKLEVSEITIEKWLGDSEPYITVNVKNVSKHTAISVIPTFQSEKDIWQFTPTKTGTVFQSGLSIESQSSMKFPIAPVNEFLPKVVKNCEGCNLMGLGLEANTPSSYMFKVCENKNPCELSSRAVPIGLNFHYKNIFNEPIHQFFVVFAYLSIN